MKFVKFLVKNETNLALYASFRSIDINKTTLKESNQHSSVSDLSKIGRFK
jgi:hypothetical protein